MKNKIELAKEYSKNWEEITGLEWKNVVPTEASVIDFLAGYDSAIEKVKEYIFNTEEHQDKDDKFYISEDYLKQTIKFLNNEN